MTLLVLEWPQTLAMHSTSQRVCYLTCQGSGQLCAVRLAHLALHPIKSLLSHHDQSIACRLQLLDEDEPIFQRYRALFGLRNQGTPEAVAALGESFAGSSALLKHEVAYVLGQMLHTLAIPFLQYASWSKISVATTLCLVMQQSKQMQQSTVLMSLSINMIAREACHRLRGYTCGTAWCLKGWLCAGSS